MIYSNLEQILRSDNKELFDKIFEKDGFSFSENITVDQLDGYDDREADELREDATKFGCIIRGNDIIIPAGLHFKINISSPKNDPTLFYIERNGVEFSISYMEDGEEIGVTFTQAGQKLYSFSKSIYTTIPNAYDQIQMIEKIFGVKIID